MLMLTFPHSGETIPKEATWLQEKDPLVLLTDVDRFVDTLYRPGCESAKIPYVSMDIHRYVIDLNRLPTDIDSSCVEGAPARSENGFVSGIHWTATTQGHALLDKPISRKFHEEILNRYYFPFHQKVEAMEKELIRQNGLPRYHIDAHSMPSVGTGAHRDGGKKRPEVVVSDCSGKSCSSDFKDKVIQAYESEGFQVSYNWPYLGGRMTEQYGKPHLDKHSVQVELNRALYMNETTRERLPSFDSVSQRLGRVLQSLVSF